MHTLARTITLTILAVLAVRAQPISVNAAHIVPGGTLPTACNPNGGDVFFKTSATLGVYFCSSTNTWTIVSQTPGTGITSLASDTTSSQTLTAGTAGTDFAISNPGGGSHVFNLPIASATNTGKLAAADWSTFNSKQAAITTGTTAQYLRGDLSLATFPTVPTVTGSSVLKGSSGNAVAALAADVTALWSGTCSASTFLRGDGSCTAAGTITGSGTTGVITKWSGSAVLTNATAVDVASLWSGTCNTGTFLRGDGTCATPTGSGTVNSGTANHLSFYATSTNAISDLGVIPASGSIWKSDGTPKPVAALAADLIALFSGCGGTQYLGADGACHTAAGNGNNAALHTANITGASPSISCSNPSAGTVDTFLLTLTGNVTGSYSISNCTAGENVLVSFCENGTGGFTLTQPTNLKGFPVINTTAHYCTANFGIADGSGNIQAVGVARTYKDDFSDFPGAVIISNGDGTSTTIQTTSGANSTITTPAVTGTFAVASTSATATQALFATTTAGAPAYRAVALTDLPVPNGTVGATCTVSGIATFCICTTTCTITVPVPVFNAQFCVQNDAGVSTVITLSAIGSSAAYEKQDGSGYGTAGTGTFVSGGALKDQVCFTGKNSTHWNLWGSQGTWTAN